MDMDKNKSLNERMLKAARYNDFEGIKKMIDAGADINYRDEDDDDAVVIAVVNHQVDILKYLIKKGAKITSLYGKKKKNILHIAIENDLEDQGFFEIINILVDAGADVNLKDKPGNTPFFYACLCSVINTKTIALLLKHGADMHSVNNYGASAFSVAKRDKDKELLDVLEPYNSKRKPK